ncbi:hypothetical protein Ddc_11891 [Ditylenchus destructor]|nr:hypothetical protein Ddc_11891 [Ditylenchus destructor]
MEKNEIIQKCFTAQTLPSSKTIPLGDLFGRRSKPETRCFGSALHIACCSGPTRPGRLAIIEQLLRYGADPNLHEPSTSAVGMKLPMVEFLSPPILNQLMG